LYEEAILKIRGGKKEDELESKEVKPESIGK
jgi:hypothetical protein